MSEVMLQNYMADGWSSDGRSSSCSSSQSSESGSSLGNFSTGFSSFNDYFGLSNLLSNVKISDDNPLLQSTQKNLSLLQRARRQSWASDGSDNAAVLSPTIESQHSYDRFDMNNNDSKFPSRLPHSVRDHNLINSAYPPQNDSRADKLGKQPLIMPPSPPATNQPISMPLPPSQQQNRGASTNSNSNNSNNNNNNGVQVCVFCRNNGESESVYTSHVLKDTDGRTSCPILRAYTCPICKANGDNSHTIKYCPMNQNARMMGQNGNNQGNAGLFPRPPFRAPFPPPPNMPAGLTQPNFQRNKNSFR